jgi:hypothetical protein
MSAATTPLPGTVKVYISARPSDLPRALALRDALRRYGIGCTSRWLDAPRETDAETRVEDIQRSDVVVFLNPLSSHAQGFGGCHTEVGIALGRPMPVIVFGARENGFHRDGSRVEFVPDGTTPDRLVVAINLAAKFGTPLPVRFGVKEGVSA